MLYTLYISPDDEIISITRISTYVLAQRTSLCLLHTETIAARGAKDFLMDQTINVRSRLSISKLTIRSANNRSLR